MNIKKDLELKVLISFSSLLLILLLAGQTYSLFDYDFTVKIGLQESANEVTPLGVEWARGFAIGDTLIYIPLLLIGTFGLLRKWALAYFAMFASLAISAYWPLVSLSAMIWGFELMDLPPIKLTVFSIILPIISLYGLWGMRYLYINQHHFLKK